MAARAPRDNPSTFAGAGLLDGISWVVGDVAARVYNLRIKDILFSFVRVATLY
jgi:hypothetical protein